MKRKRDPKPGIDPPAFVPRDIWQEELRNACGHPLTWQATDAGGMLLGLFFFADGLRRLARRRDFEWAIAEVGLSAVMVLLHGHRFTGSREEAAAGICEPPIPKTPGAGRPRVIGQRGRGLVIETANGARYMVTPIQAPP